MSPTWNWPGARWWKVDFHTHTPASKDTDAWQAVIGTSDEVTPEKWLLKYMAAGIDCVAITDHNSGAWIDRLVDAYGQMRQSLPQGFRELHLFPGVELSVNGGFHLLAVFDKDIPTSDIDSLLGRVEYVDTKGDSDGVTRKSSVEVIEAVRAAGGLPIPAHVDQPKGLLRLADGSDTRSALDANTLRQVLGRSELLAMEVVDRDLARPSVYRESGVRWSEILATDGHSFQGANAPGLHFTWVKMAEPSLEGLRLALMDGEGFSIRRSDNPQAFDPFVLPEHFIEAIEVSSARFMGHRQEEKIEFSPCFNALVGGRGTGKSTVVHCLRLASRRERELEVLKGESEPQQTFERFNRVAGDPDDRGGLTNDTEIRVNLMRDGVRYRLRWRQDGTGVAVEEMRDGQWGDSPSQTVTPDRFPLRILSQAQIATMTGESQEALLAVIDEAAGTASPKTVFEEARQRFLSLRAQVRELDGKLRGREELMVKVEDVRRKLQRFEEAQHAQVLVAFQLRSRQQRGIHRHLEAAIAIAGRVRQLAAELVPEDLPEGLFDPQNPEDGEAMAAVAHLHQVVPEAAERLRRIADEVQMATQAGRQTLAASLWQKAFEKAKADYDSLVEDLRAQGVTDPSEYGRLVQERQQLEGQEAQLADLARQRGRLLGQIETKRSALLKARQSISRQRQTFLRDTLAQNPFVRIGLLSYGRNARAIERCLRETLAVPDDRFGDDILVMENDQPSKGAVADLLRDLPEDSAAAALDLEQRIAQLKERLQQACRSQGDLGGHFNNYLKREYERRPEFLDRILTWFPEDALQVEYSRKGDGRDFQPIGQASAGQRAAAMLAFLLAHGHEPLVLDQPEDDLDNHLIYDLVVRQIREIKQRRQIIVVTHNPNIVVNGDAEMLHAMDFRRGQCRVVARGSLQHKDMREEVCRVMEGGREAFERRYRRLGRGNNR